MSLARAKRANNFFKDTVFGFVREHERAASVNAPAIIKYIVLNYYLLTDKFTKNGKCVDLQDGDTVAKPKNEMWKQHRDYVVLGSMETGHLNEGMEVSQWTLQMKGDVIIGIVSQHESKEIQFNYLGHPVGSLAYLDFSPIRNSSYSLAGVVRHEGGSRTL